MNVESDALIVQTPDCLAADMGEELVIMIAGRSIYLALDPIGRDVWSRIATPCTFSALCDRLSETYEASRTTIEADVTTLLGTLHDAGAVDIRH